MWDGKAMLACVAGGAGGLVSKTISTTGAIVPQQRQGPQDMKDGSTRYTFPPYSVTVLRFE